ncbi:hypothetical protein [Aquiflexum lacus]|uniref:hypothetical protein n=1 Tax=Aquiflexum lacus TaxID=2483805 RepID=UPI0018959D21|nr:hypothetical protein [Aquiflexum lacus]
MKKKTIGSLLVFLILGGMLLFYILGGFNPIEIEAENLGEIDLSGVHFRGRPQDEALREAFQKIEDLKKLYPEARLHTIYYSEPAGKMDTMEVFVGLESKWVKKEEGLQMISLQAQKAVVATITAHRFVMPGPMKVKARLEAFAKDQELPKPEIFVDQIIGPNEVKVIAVGN